MTVAKNSNKEKQSSALKNARRGKQMTRRSKRKKIGLSSNRQGGAYKQEEIDLWNEIKNSDGNKRHLSVHTNTETGQVRVLERSEKGEITQVLDEFKLDDFDALKQDRNEAFKKWKNHNKLKVMIG